MRRSWGNLEYNMPHLDGTLHDRAPFPQPGAALTLGLKPTSGYGFTETGKFHICTFTPTVVDKNGRKDEVRQHHPDFNWYHNQPDHKRRDLIVVLSAGWDDATDIRYLAQKLDGISPPNRRAACTGNGRRRWRWTVDRDQAGYKSGPCDGRRCEFYKANCKPQSTLTGMLAWPDEVLSRYRQAMAIDYEKRTGRKPPGDYQPHPPTPVIRWRNRSETNALALEGARQALDAAALSISPQLIDAEWVVMANGARKLLVRERRYDSTGYPLRLRHVKKLINGRPLWIVEISPHQTTPRLWLEQRLRQLAEQSRVVASIAQGVVPLRLTTDPAPTATATDEELTTMDPPAVPDEDVIEADSEAVYDDCEEQGDGPTDAEKAAILAAEEAEYRKQGSMFGSRR